MVKLERIIDESLVRGIAHLARLDLTMEEIALFQDQFGEILDYFDILNEVDTEKVLPAYETSNAQMVSRADEIEPSLALEDIIKNAPESKSDSIRIPRVHFDQ
jgi:aspartyl-tRNA(Asn)/glutamyl-tRNA(Gln) amidotransferase subunit C